VLQPSFAETQATPALWLFIQDLPESLDRLVEAIWQWACADLPAQQVSIADKIVWWGRYQWLGGVRVHEHDGHRRTPCVCTLALPAVVIFQTEWAGKLLQAQWAGRWPCEEFIFGTVHLNTKRGTTSHPSVHLSIHPSKWT